MKFYQRRGFAAVVLVLAVLLSALYGIRKAPAALPEVAYQQWICDEAKLLDAETKAAVEQYNASWDAKYYALIAVASVEDTTGWDTADFAYALGEKWGLGANDMLLLLVKDGDYYVAVGDHLLEMTDTQQSKLKSAIEPDYYAGDYDSAVVSFFRQADVFYAQLQQTAGSAVTNAEWSGTGAAADGTAVMMAVVLIVVILVVWAALDRMRYSRYCRRVRTMPGLVYHPVFWGRSRRPAPPRRPAPRRPAPPPPPPRAPRSPRPGPRPSGGQPSRHRPPSGTPGSAPRSSGGFSGGSRGGFGGSSRSSGSRGGFGGGSRSSGGSRGGFGGGGRSSGGSRGGFGGGRR